MAVAALLAVLLLPPIAQDPAYHDFADRRGLLGIPNFLNIASNLAFLAVGVAGMLLCALRKNLGARRAWLACFTGVALVCFGSAYYHLAPDNGTLVWDRLPMSIGFMALSVAVLADYINPRLEKILLAPAIVVGLASVIWWHYTDDLRPYVLVQFLPLIMLPVLLFLFRGARRDRGLLLAALLIYMLSKLAEHFDRALFDLSGEIISGHSLKHLLAATALLVIYAMLRRRARPAEPAVSS
ncbi:MAG TPA: ceramidase domain-containing protein [Sulfuricaulis sp.]|nr:ceramidase domain-containing protein [Sulfuricaulis sp.]